MILTWHDTWHATSTCHIMPSWADTGTYRDHPGPLLETMPCIESSVIMCAFFPDDFMHAFSIACRKTSHNWLHMAPPSKQLRYMTDGVLLRETLFEPDLDRYCAWKPRDFMFPMKPILHSKTQTWLYKNSEQSHDFWGWWVSRHSRLVDSCWLHMTPYLIVGFRCFRSQGKQRIACAGHYKAVIMDEAHEGSLNTDVLFGVLWRRLAI